MTDQLPPSQTADKYIVRFPDGMRGRIAESAKSNNRSLNAEIVARLEATFQGSHGLPAPLESQLFVSHIQADLAAMTLQEFDLRHHLRELGEALALAIEHVESKSPATDAKLVKSWKRLSKEAIKSGTPQLDELRARLDAHARAVIKNAEIKARLTSHGAS